MATWMSSGSFEVMVQFIADEQGTASGIDLKTKCVAKENAKSYTWLNRRNSFEQNNACYTCDLRSDKMFNVRTTIVIQFTRCRLHRRLAQYRGN